MDIDQLEELFVKSGGEFLCPISRFKEKLSKIKAFVFDWDGVFNAGIKGKNVSSTFAEPDAMALNMVRFGYSLVNGQIPITGIITGMRNDSALIFAEREHLHVVYQAYKNKYDALMEMCKQFQLAPDEVAYCFDDILDIPICQHAGLRLMVRRNGSPLLENYMKKNGLVDYLTANQGTQYAVREAVELLLGTYGVYDQVVDLRVKFEGRYERYFIERNQLPLEVNTWGKHDANESRIENKG